MSELTTSSSNDEKKEKKMNSNIINNNENQSESMLPPPNRTPTTTTTTTATFATNNGNDKDDVRHMNDTTMPPPSRYARQKKQQQQQQYNNNNNNNNNGTAAATNNRTKKRVPAVNPRARFGLHDWKRLLVHSKDLAQRKGRPIRRNIPMSEIKQHNKVHDGWMVLRGRVYNVGPYLAYHPGGVSILKGLLGKDGTAFFDKYHQWVNIEGLIGPLLLGTVDMSTLSSRSKEAALSTGPKVASATQKSSLLGGGNDDDSDDDSDSEEEDLLPPAP